MKNTHIVLIILLASMLSLEAGCIQGYFDETHLDLNLALETLDLAPNLAPSYMLGNCGTQTGKDMLQTT